MSAVRTVGLTKHYGDVVALDGVGIELAENTLYGLLGANGAGKTTLMQVLTGQVFETAGTVEVFGEAPRENAGVLSRICCITESQRYPDAFDVKHVMAAARRLFPGWDAAFARDLAGEFRLPADRSIKNLSRGQLSAVGVIVGLASRAPLTFFDEPYLGLDAAARQLFYDRLLADYAEHPRTIVLSTHLIDEVSNLVEHVVVLDEGRVLIDENVDALRERAVVVSGQADVVEEFVLGRTELHREHVGGFLRVTVTGAARSSPPGLRFEPVSLQQLVVRSTQAPVGAGKELP